MYNKVEVEFAARVVVVSQLDSLREKKTTKADISKLWEGKTG